MGDPNIPPFAPDREVRAIVLAVRFVDVAVAQEMRGAPKGLLETAAEVAPPDASAAEKFARANEIKLEIDATVRGGAQ